MRFYFFSLFSNLESSSKSIACAIGESRSRSSNELYYDSCVRKQTRRSLQGCESGITGRVFVGWEFIKAQKQKNEKRENEIRFHILHLQ